VRLARRPEVRLDADVQGGLTDGEPHAAAAGERRGLPQLGESEQVAVERAGDLLGVGRGRDLDVVEADDLATCGRCDPAGR
jgi:hypothetical protein